MSSRSSRTLYVGNLPGDIKEWEVEDLFYKYGPIVDIDLKVPPRPPGYCFIEFEDARDAEDAIRGRDGYNFDGHRIRVELAHGGRRVASSVRSSSYSNGGGGGGGGGRGGRGGGVSRRTDYRVLVSGLPSSASWQDLKDHMRQAGDVCYAEVFRDSNGTCGTVDYTNLDDMKYAVRKLDDSEFKNAFSRSYIQVREYGSKKSISRSRSRSRSRSLSNSRSRSNSRSPSHSRSIGRSNRKAARRLPSRSRSRSSSRSRTRSPSISRKVARRSPSRSISRSPSRSRPRSPSISRKVARQSSSQSRSRSPSRARLHSPSISGSKSRSLSPRRLPSAPKRPSRSISKSRSPSCS